MHWYMRLVPAFLERAAAGSVISLALESAGLSPEAAVSLIMGHKGKLHSIPCRLRVEQFVALVSFSFSLVGLTYPGQPIGWLTVQFLDKIKALKQPYIIALCKNMR